MENKGHIRAETAFITGMVAVVVMLLVHYPGNKGFNPSDDGVVLAQSWRILNGEVPHLDFISLRPALSGYLHSLHFFSPLPLEDSARWFVILQNLFISFAWLDILFACFFPGTVHPGRKHLLFAGLGLYTFAMNMNQHGIYPWTTVDGLFWAVAGSYFLLRTYRANLSNRAIWWYSSMAIFFMSLATLSRQTFAVPLLISMIVPAISYYKRRKLPALLVCWTAGLLPVMGYLCYLEMHHALPQFFRQMHGHTELFETGILRFIKSFLKSELLVIFLPALLFAGWFFLSSGTKIALPGKALASRLATGKSRLVRILAACWLTLLFGFSVYLLVSGLDRLSFHAFDLLWILAVAILFSWRIVALSKGQKAILLLALLLAWVSSLSLGSNSPVYSLGIVASTASVLLLHILRLHKDQPVPDEPRLWNWLALAGIIIFITSIFTQRHANYRDKPLDGLTCNLGEMIPSMGSTRTNAALAGYYAEFLSLYRTNPQMRDHFALLPNNAFIYPALKSRNPFPLDWMQQDEYAGQEALVNGKIAALLKKDTLYILVDRFNTKVIADTLQAVDYFSSGSNYLHDWSPGKYGYMSIIQENMVEVNAGLHYFRVFTRKDMIGRLQLAK